MSGPTFTRTIGLPGCLLAVLLAFLDVPAACADPFFVRVYGRTYKIDPRDPPGEQRDPKPQEAMKALPADLARGPGFRPSHEEVLAEVEERTWVAHGQLAARLQAAASRERRDAEGDESEIEREITGSLAQAARGRSPELQAFLDRYRALNLLARELRRAMDLPVKTPETGFSRPKLTPEVEASYRDLKFDPLAAYYGFRRVKAAFRSGDIELLTRIAHFPLTVTGKTRRTIRNREQLAAMKQVVLDPRIREIVAKATFATLFVRDKGAMLGEGEVWITRNGSVFGLGVISLE